MVNETQKNICFEALILAGGKSTRMGYDKQLIKVKGKYLILDHIDKLKQHDKINHHFDHILVSCNHPLHKYEMFGCVTSVKDKGICMGPIAGLYAGLENVSSDYVFVLACDSLLNEDWLMWMCDEAQRLTKEGNAPQIIVAEKEADYYEPLNALYHRSMLTLVKKHILSNQYSLQKLIRSTENKHVMPFNEVGKRYKSQLFINFNTRSELKAYALGESVSHLKQI